MAAQYLFLFLLGLANASLSNFKSTDLLSEMIAEQSRKCPYIAFCHKPNSSVYNGDASGSLSPCCKECSCKDSCVEEGSCCPDYFTKDFLTETAHTHLSTMEQSITTKGLDGTECVKIQHGPFRNQKGYMMVATCRSTYDDVVVKNKCEMKLDYHFAFNLLDHVPVTDIDRVQTYKNRHCGQCNMQTNSSFRVWNISLTCELSFFYFNLFPVKDVFTFIESAVSDSSCNLSFEDQTTDISENTTLTNCTYNTMIDKCNNDTSNDDLHTLCSQYTWPIETRVKVENRLYKNYACMLCNGVKFRGYCLNFTRMKAITIHFTTDFNSNLLSISSDTPRASQQIINRYFPNKDGDVHCKKGFVYDVRKGTCRLVLCPLYFIVTDGECVPLFRTIKGVQYNLLLQADVKESTGGLEVATVTKSIYDILHEHLGEELEEVYILANQNIPVKNRYFVHIVISGNFSQGSYVSILKFTNYLLQRSFTFNESSSVFFSFNTTIALESGNRKHALFSNKKENFVLIDSYKKEGKDLTDDRRTPMYISPVLLCYRVTLSDDELRVTVLKYIYIQRRKIHPKNLQIIKKKRLYIICLNHCLQNIAGTTNIFLRDESTNYTFISNKKINVRKYKRATTPVGENESEDLNKSLVATVATVAFVAVIVIIRRIMKRFKNLQQIDTYIVEYVNERNVESHENT